MPIEPIPTEIRPVEAPDPMHAVVNALRVKSALDTQKMNAAHMQQYELQNQERQHAIEAEKALSEDILSNRIEGTDPNGLFSVNRAAVMEAGAKRGMATHYQKWEAAQRANDKAALDNYKSKLDSAEKNLKLMGNLLMPVTQEKDDIKAATAYTINRDRAIQLGLGTDETLPRTFDRERVNAWAQSAVDAEKQVTEARLLADHHARIAENAPKTAREWYGLFSGAQSQAGLDSLRAHAHAVGAPAEVLSSIPKEHTPEGMQALTALAQTPEQRIAAPGHEADAEQKVRAEWSNRLRQVRTPEAYMATLRNAPAWIADEARQLVPPDQFDSAKSPKAFRNWGLTSQQAQQAEEDAQREANLEKSRRTNEQLQRDSQAIRKQIADRGVNTQFQLREADKHDALQKQVEEARNEADQLYSLVTSPDGREITVKGKGSVKLNSVVRADVARDYMRIKTRADELAKQATEMRRRYQWGEFGGGPAGQATIAVPSSRTTTPAPAPAAQGEQPAPVAAPPKAVMDALPVGDHTFKNGQTWRKNADGSVVRIGG